MIKKIETEKAPKAIGPYSQATCAGNFVFVSGQIPADPENGTIVSEDVAVQAIQVFKNVKAVLSAAGCSLDDVVKTEVYLKDMDDFATVNEIYAEHFKGDVLPARAAVEVARLPKEVKVEVSAIAYCSEFKKE